jgi:alpha-glucosidase
MFGKIKSVNNDDNKIIIQFEKIYVTVEIINPSIINFFVPIYRKKRVSKAIENLVVEKSEFKVDERKDCIVITTEKLQVKIFDDFKVDIYDINGNVLCEDYREYRNAFMRRRGNLDILALEGHKVAKDTNSNVMVLKKLDDNTFFYGLGEETGHLNKKGYH